VVVRVDDVNDHAPTIRINTPGQSGGNRGPEIVNGSDVGSFVAHVTVEDRDSGPNGRFHCRVTDNSRMFDLRQLYATEFKVVTLTRVVAPVSSSPARVRFSITCRDDGRPSLSSVLPVEVTIVGRNDHAPEFELTEYGFAVAENEVAGRVIGHLTANDPDEGPAGTVRYHTDIEGTDGPPCAEVHPSTGAVVTSVSFDRERSPACEIFVIASDGGVPPRSARVNVRITVADVDDSAAKFQQSNYVFSVPENEPANTEVGRVVAVDADKVPFSDVVYAVQSISGYDVNGSAVSVADIMAFSVDSSIGLIVTSYPLDRETVSSYRLYITASSTVAKTSRTATAKVVVRVIDRNDNRPVFLFPATMETADGGERNPLIVPTSASVGDTVATVSAADLDTSANAQLAYRIIGSTPTSGRSLFALDRISGRLTVARALRGVGIVRLELEAIDGGEVLPEKHRLTTKATLFVEIGVGGSGIGSDRRMRRVKDDSLMSALASEHLAIILTSTLAAILVVISAIIAVLCLLRLRRMRRPTRHNDVKYDDVTTRHDVTTPDDVTRYDVTLIDVKYVDSVSATFYSCPHDLSCFRFQDGDATGSSLAAVRDMSELKKLPLNVDGDVACKEYQVGCREYLTLTDGESHGA